jgi:hypothetical protein
MVALALFPLSSNPIHKSIHFKSTFPQISSFTIGVTPPKKHVLFPSSFKQSFSL